MPKRIERGIVSTWLTVSNGQEGSAEESVTHLGCFSCWGLTAMARPEVHISPVVEIREALVISHLKRPWPTARNLHFNILNGLVKKEQMAKVCHFRENNEILRCLICLFFHTLLYPPSHCKDFQMQQNLKQNTNNSFLVI